MCGIAECYQQADGQRLADIMTGRIAHRGPLRQLIQDEQAGREDRAKQIRQLLTLEQWYRNARSAGVAAWLARTG